MLTGFKDEALALFGPWVDVAAFPTSKIETHQTVITKYSVTLSLAKIIELRYYLWKKI